MNQEFTRQIRRNGSIAFRIFLYAMLIPVTAVFIYEGMRDVGFLGRFIGTTIIFNDDGTVEAAGIFGFPYYLPTMMEVR